MRMRNEAATLQRASCSRGRSARCAADRVRDRAGSGRHRLVSRPISSMTLLLMPLLWPWCGRSVGALFSVDDLRAALRFGLPRLPHGLAQQALDAGNKLLLSRFIPLDATRRLPERRRRSARACRFFTSAFETAWAPFYYDTARQPDAKDVFRRMTTYGVAVLTLLVAVTIGGRARRDSGDAEPGLDRRIARHSVHRDRPRPAGRLSADVDRPEPHQPHRVLSGRRPCSALARRAAASVSG